jgi:hypothetical protein
LVGDCFGNVLEPDCFDDDRRTILGADIVNLAKALAPEAVDLQGLANMVNKSCSRDGDKRARSFMWDASAYKLGLVALAGDAVWKTYDTEKQFSLYKERALFVYEEKIAGGGDGSWVLDPKPLCCPPTSGQMYNLDPNLIDSAMRLYVDANRSLHVRYVTKHRKGIVCKIDYTFISAVHLGSGKAEGVMLTIVDEDDHVVCVLFCPSTRLELIKPTLTQLFDEGFRPLVLSMDNVPVSDDKMNTAMIQTFRSCISTIEYLVQDLFHAVAGFTKVFPNQNEDWFHKHVTLPLRSAMREMESTKLAELRLLIGDGKVKITSSYRGDTVSIDSSGLQPNEIDDLILSGHFFKMFCSGHRCVIPMIFHSKLVMQRKLWALHKVLSAELFDEDGRANLINGSFMVGATTRDRFRKEFANFVGRALNCIPPDDRRVEYYSLIPRPGKMPLVKYKLMTGSNESLHSRVGAVGGATNSSKEYKHAHATISVAEMQRRKEAKEGSCTVGHLDFQINIDTNKMAQDSGVLKSTMPVPVLAPEDGVAKRSATFLRPMTRTLQTPGSNSATRQLGPFERPKPVGRIPTLGIRPFLPEPKAKMPAPVNKRARNSTGSESASKRAKKLAKGSSAHDLNRWPCTCSKSGSSFNHLFTCERQKRKSACLRAAEASLPYDDALVPKPTVGLGGILFYQQSASPLIGGMCFPKHTARSKGWVRIGSKCDSCGKFDRAKGFRDEIDMLMSKYKIEIKVCSC